MALVRGSIANPTRKLAEYLAPHAANRLSKSVLAVATPQYAGQLARLAADLPDLQTVAVAVDSTPLGAQRNGISWAVFGEPLTILDRLPLSAAENPDASDRNWAMSGAALRLTAGVDIAMPVANTVFSTGKLAAMYAGDNQELGGLHVRLPERLAVKAVSRPTVPLSDEHTITDCVDNMLKTIDGKAAASFLENAAKLIAPETQERTVFAEVSSPGLPGREYIKVVAGGGGLWSPKSRMLVLEPPSSPKKGQKIRFHLSTGNYMDPDTRAELERHHSQCETWESMVLETAPTQESIDEVGLVSAGRNQFWPVFGMGSEQGFLLDDIKHNVVGEAVALTTV